ncbi:hypothetical protein D3C75_1158370 [compost metagenome]
MQFLQAACLSGKNVLLHSIFLLKIKHGLASSTFVSSIKVVYCLNWLNVKKVSLASGHLMV